MNSLIEKYTSNNNIIIVLFHKPECHFCVQFMPIYNTLTKQYNKPNVYFGIINCSVHSINNMDNKYNKFIEGVPTILKISNNTNSISKFDNERTVEKLIEFIED